MKRFLVSALTVLMSMGVAVSAASATQLALNDAEVDHNNDGNFTIHELISINRDLRNKK